MIASLNGVACSRARVQVGAWGAWWADMTLTEELTLARGAAASIAFAGAALSGTVVAGGAINGTSGYRVIGGKGGWGKPIPAKGYANDLGVRYSNVIVDAARLCGEIVENPPSDRLGPHYARANSVASSVLPVGAWRVDFDGVTRFGLRPTVAYTGQGVRTRVDTQGNIFEIATEDVGTLLPGVTIDGSDPATDVEFLLDANRLTVRVYAGRKSARRVEAMRTIVESLFPDLKWRGTFEFRVVSQFADRYNLQPVRVATGMPELSNVPTRGHAGIRETVTLGELVLVTFVDADPSRPNIIAHGAPDEPGWMPQFLELGEAPTLGVARVTDPVICGAFGGTVAAASTRIKAGL